jgi:hypothetical protein
MIADYLASEESSRVHHVQKVPQSTGESGLGAKIKERGAHVRAYTAFASVKTLPGRISTSPAEMEGSHRTPLLPSLCLLGWTAWEGF